MRLAVVPIPGTRPDGMLFDGTSIRATLEVARLAERLGIDDLALSEHVIMANRPERYPYGAYPHRIEEPWPEPFALLSAMAAVTERLRLITGIVIAPLRPAVLLAKSAATLHALSEGRFVLGVSTSWQEDEYAALGVPFRERGARLDDAIGACRALWAGAPASFRSPSVSFEELSCVPRPQHPDDIPIWFGGALSPRLVRRVAEVGQGWLPFVGPEPRPLEMMRRGVELISERMQVLGRDPRRLEVSALVMPRGRDLQATLEHDVPRFRDAGVTHLRVQISTFVASREGVPEFLDELAARFTAFR